VVKTILFEKTNILGGTVILNLKLHYPTADRPHETYYAEQHGLRLIDAGELSVEHDLLDFLIVPSYIKPSFLDSHAFLFNLLTGDYEDSDKLDTRVEVILELEHSGGKEVHQGFLVEDTLEYNYESKELQFDAAPKTDILNNTFLFDRDDNTPINPFGVENGEYIPLKLVLYYLFKLVRPELDDEMYFNHNLKFFGAKIDNPLWKITDLTIDNIELPTSLLFFTEQRGNATAGDLLKTIAASFFSIVGFKDGVTPFFVSMENTFTLRHVSSEKIINKKVSISEPSPKYFKVNNLDNQNASISYGNTNVSDEFKLEQDIVYYANGWLRENGASSHVNGFNFRLFRSWWEGINFVTEHYHCHGVRDPLATIYADEFEYEETPAMLLRKWRKYASSYSLNRVVEFTLLGLDYDFLRNYLIDNITYRPISIVRKIGQNQTIMKAVPIVEG